MTTPKAEPVKKVSATWRKAREERAAKADRTVAPDPVASASTVDKPVEGPGPEQATPKRTRRAAADRPPVTAFARGQLRDAVLSHLQGLPPGETTTAGAIARALNSHASPVATNLVRMVKAGLVVTSEPARYRAA